MYPCDILNKYDYYYYLYYLDHGGRVLADIWKQGVEIEVS